MTAMLMISDERSISFLASINARRYGSLVAANSATGTPSPESKRSTSSHLPARSFFSPAFYGGAVREDFGPIGFLLRRSWRPAQCYRLSSPSDAGSSPAKGAVPMRHILTLNPSTASARNKAAAHRAMAIAALHADSSLSVRLKRYNAAMAKARALEAAGGAL